MDISGTIQPKSDQLNFDDVMAAPLVVTVAEVKVFNRPDQPVELHLVEFPGRAYKPNKSMRRVLYVVWGKDGSLYVGRKLQLIGDPSVKWGGKEVGGIKISHMSHIAETQVFPLSVSRGHRETYRVEPLKVVAPVAPPDGWEADVAGCESVDEIQSFYEMAREAGWWSPVVAEACTKRKQVLAGE